MEIITRILFISITNNVFKLSCEMMKSKNFKNFSGKLKYCGNRCAFGPVY